MTEITQSLPSHLERKRADLLRRQGSQIELFQKAALGRQARRMSRMYRRICQTNEFLHSLDQIEREIKPRETTNKRYTVSSLFLYECFKKLTADEKEQFVFITGSEVDGVMVLDQVIDLVHKQRSVVGVEADPRSTHRLLIRLEQFGHRLLAHFHSHPGTGPGATHPSGIDRSFQQRLESAGHVAVAAIFSRDGYVRFLRLDGSFDLEIHGSGVEECERNVYRLTDLGAF